MTEVITIGVDLAKSIFHIHGVDASGETVIRKKLRRRQVLPFLDKLAPCLVGMEACATAHHWGREIRALGHEVKPMPHRTRDPLVRQRTMPINAPRAHLAPGSSPGQALLGVVAPTGVPHVKKLLKVARR